MTDPVVKTVPKQNNPPHRFKKGESGNPAGRPKGQPQYQRLLLDAIKREEVGGFKCACRCQTLLQHLIVRSKKNDKVLCAIVNKLIPDLQHQTGTPPTSIIIQYGHQSPRVLVTQPLPVNGD